jgi:hypothetical protein
MIFLITPLPKWLTPVCLELFCALELAFIRLSIYKKIVMRLRDSSALWCKILTAIVGDETEFNK